MLFLAAAGLAVPAAGAADSAPPGATAKCRDGSYSYSQHHSGTCSHHGGVAFWLDGTPSSRTWMAWPPPGSVPLVVATMPWTFSGTTTWSTDARIGLDVVEKLDLDIIRRSGYPTNGGRGFVYRPEDELYIDEWGVPHHRAEFETGYGGAHFEIRIYPLAEATAKDLDDYPWPDPHDPSFLGDLPDELPRIYKDTPYAILGQFGRHSEQQRRPLGR